MVERIENKRIESIRKEKNDKIREKLRQQIKNVLLLTEEDTNGQSLPKNCQLYQFECPKCCKKFRQIGSLKKHVRANECPSQPFVCIYCDQRYTQYKSVVKHIRENRCRAVNTYRNTHDSSVLACESDVGSEIDKHIVRVDNSPTGIQRVDGVSMTTSQKQPGIMEKSPDNRAAKVDNNKLNTGDGGRPDIHSCT